jgi:hypothetical protein
VFNLSLKGINFRVLLPNIYTQILTHYLVFFHLFQNKKQIYRIPTFSFIYFYKIFYLHIFNFHSIFKQSQNNFILIQHYTQTFKTISAYRHTYTNNCFKYYNIFFSSSIVWVKIRLIFSTITTKKNILNIQGLTFPIK